MGNPALLIDYDELEHISGLLDAFAHDMAEDKSNICYDEISTVTCNKSAYDACIDEYMVREKIMERLSDTAVEVSKYGITFSDVESSMITTQSKLGREYHEGSEVIGTPYDHSKEKIDFEEL